MIAELKVGPQVAADGSQVTGRATKDASIVTVNGHGKYLEALLRGNTYILGVSGATPVVYAGAAAGTPLLAIHNPTGSGKVLSLLGLFIANRAAASAAGVVTFGIYGGPSAQPTGTQTVPRNLLTMTQSGSIAIGFANAALTGSTALSYLASPFAYYWATAAGAVDINNFFDLSGMFIVAPGNQLTIGASAALTSATWDVSWVWEELAQ
jgi:hypothetical protein